MRTSPPHPRRPTDAHQSRVAGGASSTSPRPELNIAPARWRRVRRGRCWTTTTPPSRDGGQRRRTRSTPSIRRTAPGGGRGGGCGGWAAARAAAGRPRRHGRQRGGAGGRGGTGGPAGGATGGRGGTGGANRRERRRDQRDRPASTGPGHGRRGLPEPFHGAAGRHDGQGGRRDRARQPLHRPDEGCHGRRAHLGRSARRTSSVLKAAFICDVIRCGTFCGRPARTTSGSRACSPARPPPSTMHHPQSHKIGTADTAASDVADLAQRERAVPVRGPAVVLHPARGQPQGLEEHARRVRQQPARLDGGPVPHRGARDGARARAACRR